MNVLRELSFKELIAKRDALAQEMRPEMSEAERDAWRSRYWSLQSEINFRTRTPRLVESIMEDGRRTRGNFIAWAVATVIATVLLVLWITVM